MGEEREELAEEVEIDELLNEVLLAALNEGKKRLLEGNLVPFTALAVGEKLLIETHPAQEVEDCFAAAERAVALSAGADAYAFCYDGYVDTEEGQRDIIIAEGGLPGESEAFALGYFYTMGEAGESPVVQDEPVYVGPAPNFMAEQE